MKQGVAVIGDEGCVRCFQSVGFAGYPAANGEEALIHIRKLTEENCAVIYLTEQLAAQIPQVLRQKQDAPAIILIPGQEGILGTGQESLQSAIRRAIGTERGSQEGMKI